MAAIRAAQLGAKVTVVEEQALGGVCLNWGCIPSKALLSVVEFGEKARKAADLGVKLDGLAGYDLARMVARKNQVVDTLVKGVATLFKTWGIEHINGRGALQSARTVEASLNDGGTRRLEADAIIVATGSGWPNLPLFPIDGRRIVTSKEALDPETVPGRLLIVGGGVEGCEFAALYSALGSHVTVVEMLPRILPLEDEEIATTLARELKKRGVTLYTGTTVERVERDADSVKARLKDGSTVDTDQILVSIGRRFNTQGIGLEKAGVAMGPRGEIEVDAHLQTNVPGIYAIGDVTGKAMLAHVASAQGKVAVANIMGRPHPMRYDVIPAGIFTLPEIGRVGLTEQQARDHVASEGGNPDSDVRVGRFRHVALGKAHAVGDTVGLVKIVADTRHGTVLGAHLIGSHAADLVHEVAVAMQAGATVETIADTIHAHPTLAEGVMEAAEDVQGLAIHLARKKA